MMKHLKLDVPFIKTFPNLTHVLAITQDIHSAKTWFINNFIQLQINEDVSYSNLNANFCFGDLLNPFIKCPFIKTEVISKEFIEDYRITLYSIIKRSVDLGQYVCIPADWFYIPNSEYYQKKHIAHEVLISGYDSENGEIEISDFFRNGYYSTERCAIENLTEAFNLVPSKPCLLENNILILSVKAFNYSFNIEFAIQLLSDYCYGRNSNFRFNPISKYPDFLSDDVFVFGVNVYEVLLKYIDNVIEGKVVLLDTRSFHLIEQHKVVIANFLNYICENGYIAKSTLTDEYEKVVKYTSIIKKLVLKYNILSDKNILQSIKKYLVNTKNVERQVLKYVLDNIRKKPRLYRKNNESENNNSAVFLGIDNETKGNWRYLYGKSGYDILFEKKECEYIRLLYHNWIEKIWNKASDSELALQSSDLGMQRVEMCNFFKKEAYIDVLITNGRTYVMSLYILDACSMERNFELRFFDGDTDLEIMKFPVKILAEGIYIKFKVSGHIRIEFINHIPTIGVISGVFFDGEDEICNKID